MKERAMRLKLIEAIEAKQTGRRVLPRMRLADVKFEVNPPAIYADPEHYEYPALCSKGTKPVRRGRR
jgi:hypothetical protein